MNANDRAQLSAGLSADDDTEALLYSEGLFPEIITGDVKNEGNASTSPWSCSYPRKLRNTRNHPWRFAKRDWGYGDPTS